MSTSILSSRPSLLMSGLVAAFATACPLPENQPGDESTAGGTTSGEPGTTQVGTEADASTTDTPTTGDTTVAPTTDESTTDASTTDASTTDDSTTDDSTTDATTGATGEAMIRFINLSDGPTTRFLVDDQLGAELFFTQTAHYQPFPAGARDVSATNGEGVVLADAIGYEFEAGKKYTVAGMGLHMADLKIGNPTMWVNVDGAVDAVDVPADHTRITLVNAAPDKHGIYAQLDYDNEFFIDFYEKNAMQLLAYVQQIVVDCPYPKGEQSDTMTMVAQWGVPAETQQLWKAAALLQVANNESIYVFLTCTGMCNSNADRFLLAMPEDSMAFTVETP